MRLAVGKIVKFQRAGDEELSTHIYFEAEVSAVPALALMDKSESRNAANQPASKSFSDSFGGQG